MDQPADRWAFLLPWVAPVHSIMNVRVDASSRVEIVVCPPSQEEGATPAQLRAIRHALLLLSVLSRVDFGVFMHVLVEYCGAMTESERLEMDAVRNWSFWMRLPDCWDNTEAELFSTTLRWLLTDEDGGVPGDTRRLAAVVRRLLAQDVANGGDGLSGQSVDIPISLKVNPVRVTSSLERLWAELKALRARNGSWRFPVPLQLNGVQLDCGITLGPVNIENEFLEAEDRVALEDMATNGSGLELSSVTIPPLERCQVGHRGQVYQLLERYLCCSGSRAEQPALITSVVCVAFGAEIARVCSAIAEARIPTKVALYIEKFPPELSTWIWQWVAYALFSQHAREASSVTSVILTTVIITEADAEAVAQVLHSPDPLRVLFPQLGDHWCTTRAAGLLQAGTTLTLMPMHESEVLAPAVTAWELEVDVSGVLLADVPGRADRVRMLLPGYGLCEVRRADVVPITEDPRPASAMPSVLIEFDNHLASLAGFDRLLELIGPSLTSLVIESKTRVAREVMPWILRRCPNLKTLDLGYGSIDASEFVREYKEAKLEVEKLCCSVTDLVDLAVELKDCRSRLSRSLKHLECDMFPRRLEGWPNPETLSAVADMLKVNRSLEYLRLKVPGVIYNTSEREVVLQFHNRLAPVTQQQFPMACRLAFLSIFASSSRGSSGAQAAKKQMKESSKSSPKMLSRVLAKLSVSPDIFVRIFEFAAIGVPRRVHVFEGESMYWSDNESDEDEGDLYGDEADGAEDDGDALDGDALDGDELYGDESDGDEADADALDGDELDGDEEDGDEEDGDGEDAD